MIIDKGDKMALTAKSGKKVIVRLEVNPKAKRLILRLDEQRREAVAIAPSKRKLKAAAVFAKERVDWLAKHLSDLPEYQALADGETFNLRGQPCLISRDGPGRRAVLEAGEPQVLRVPGLAESADKRVVRFLRKQAELDLCAAVERHCSRLHVTAQRVAVKDTRTRWGSCTADGRLAFSWRLVMAPASVLDYVAAHECAHLLEMNHSKAFWAHVETCCPNWKRERAWLRQQGRELHAVGA